VISRAARLEAEGKRLLELCFAFGGQLKPTDLLSPELRTDSGFVIASEELGLPCGRVIKVLGLEAHESDDPSFPKELCVQLLWSKHDCFVRAKSGNNIWVGVAAHNTKTLSTLSVSVLVRYARVLEKMIESVRQRAAALEEYEGRCAEGLVDEVRGMLAEDVVD
jgi:hypothetical protein